VDRVATGKPAGNQERKKGRKVLNMAAHAILGPSVASLARAWLADDIPKFDAAGAVVGRAEATATMLAKSPGILAGEEGS